MKKLFTILVSTLIILSPLVAFDWGGYLDNNSTIQKTEEADVAFNQSNAIFLWASSPLGENMYIKGEGMYKYNFNTATKDFTNIVDLDLLKFAGDFTLDSGTLSLSAGRFIFSDLTGIIFSQTSDGVFAQYNGQTFGVSLYAGFTGLLNNNTVSMLDFYMPEEPNEIYDLSTKYIPVNAIVSLPSLFLNQTLSLQASGFIDVNSRDEKINKMYATVDFTGPITNMIFYNASTTMGTENFKNLMNLSNLSVSVFPTSNLFVNAGVLYASGDHIGMESFGGFSSHPVANAAIAIQAESCMIPSITANMSLLQDKMLLSLGGKGVFIFDKELADKSIDATGFQGDISAIYNIFPDLQIGLTGSLFKGFNDYSALDNFSATFKFAVTF